MRGIGVVLLAVLVGLMSSSPALAAFPGQNGRIAFAGAPAGSSSPTYTIRTINPDGTGVTQLSPGQGSRPAWSPDGQRIAFQSARDGGTKIWAINADGSDEVRLTTDNTHNHGDPSWTPDGTKILFASNLSGTSDIWRMNADGTGQAKVGGSDTQHDYAPVTSPDGSRIAFERTVPANNPQIWLMDPDGTNEQLLGEGSRPDWSPDGTRIVFSRFVEVECDENQVVPVSEIFRMNANGTAVTQLTHSGASCFSARWSNWPVWSPNGAKIAWSAYTQSFSTSLDPDDQLLIMDADGGNGQSLGNELLETQPDWQPVQPGYPRPKAATSLRASLVPAHIVCAAPNRAHGPPLASASCSPPQQRSAVLTTGSPDANGAAARMTGSVRLAVQAGNQATPADEADVAVEISITDVRCRTTNAACPGGTGSDYEGRLLGVLTALRITDRLNTPPGPVGGPGTAEGALGMPVQCAATAADPGVGSTCSLSTTVDALLPGAIREGKRAVWELGQIHVRDAGPNGSGFESPVCPPACGDGDETLFLREGVFVP